jgi:hypothetical protein
MWGSVITYTLFYFCLSGNSFSSNINIIPGIRQKCRVSFHIFGKSAGFHSTYSAKVQGFISHIRQKWFHSTYPAKVQGFIPHIRQKCRVSFHIFGKSAGFHSTYLTKVQGFIPHIRWGRTDPFHVFSERHTVYFHEGAKICKAAPIFFFKTVYFTLGTPIQK